MFVSGSHIPRTVLAPHTALWHAAGASIRAEAVHNVWVIFSYWFLEANVCGGFTIIITFILSTGPKIDSSI